MEVEQDGVVALGRRSARPWEPARRRVYEYVRDGILQGELQGGTFLEEAQISQAVGVSRTPVREAFQQLHGDRLIELVPRRGAMVRVVTARELLEIYDTRLMFEIHAVRGVCRDRIAVPEAMREAANAMLTIPDSKGTEHVRLNTVFHQALVHAAGNTMQIELYDSLRLRQERVALTSVSISPDRLRQITQEHVSLIDALDKFDIAAAIAVLSEHLRPVREIVARLPNNEDN